MTMSAALRSRPHTSSYDAAIEVRPLERGDKAAVLEIFDGLGPRSRALRFLTAKPRLTHADLRQLTEVDQHDHVALLAVRHGHPIGVARFVRDQKVPDSADVAVAVVDASQNRGVATLLTSALVERAREVGVRRFTMAMARDNQAAMRLLRSAPGEIEPLALDDQTAEFVLTLHDTHEQEWTRIPGSPAGPLSRAAALP
jgi:GNAT superfamily N-acetyltransferase